MVFEEDDIDVGVLSEVETVRMESRKQFYKNLEKAGLELELEGKQVSTYRLFKLIRYEPRRKDTNMDFSFI